MDYPSLLLLVALAVAVIVVVPVFGLGRKPKERLKSNSPLDRQMVINKWQEINQMVKMGGSSQLKNAVIEADKLLDYVLKAKVGDDGTLADRLKRAQKYFSNKPEYNNLWYAHKVRNQIAHETGFNLSPNEAKKVIGYFEKSFKKLGVI